MLANAKIRWAKLEAEAPIGVNIVELKTMVDGIATTFYEYGDILQYHLRFPDAYLLPKVGAFHDMSPLGSVLNLAADRVCPHTRVPPHERRGSWECVHSEPEQ